MIDVYDEYAWLYDAAFSWDISDEARWLVERLGARILEPACGSGRMLEALVRAGARVAGFDRSRAMLERARERFRGAGLPEPPLVDANLEDCESIDWGEAFDGVVLPIATFGYLQTEGTAARHLAGVAAHVRAGGRYLIQLELKDVGDFVLRKPEATCSWDTPHPRGTIRCSVFGRDWDPEKRIETEISRYEILDGPEAGFVHECEHFMRVWDWESWQALIENSPFRQTAAFDGNAAARPEVSMGPTLEGQKLTWHHLEKR